MTILKNAKIFIDLVIDRSAFVMTQQAIQISPDKYVEVLHQSPPIMGHLYAVMWCDVSKNGNLAITSSFDGTVRIWNTSTWEQLDVLFFLEEPIEFVQLSPDMRYIVAITSENSRVYLHDLSTQESKQILNDYVIRSIAAWDMQGRYIAFVDFDNILLVYDAENDTIVWKLELNDEVGGRSLTWLPNSYIICGFRGGKLRFFDFQSRQEIEITLENPHDGQIMSLDAISPTQFIAISEEGLLVLWDLVTLKPLFEYKFSGTIINGTAIGENVLLLGLEKEIHVIYSEKNVETIRHSITGSNVLAFPDGTRFMRGFGTNQAAVWDLKTLKIIQKTPSRMRTVEDADLIFNKGLIATASANGKIYLIDMKTGDAVIELPGHKEMASSVAVNEEYSIVASGGFDDTLRYWNIDTQQQLGIVQNAPLVSAVTFFRGSRMLAAACSGDYSIRGYQGTEEQYRVETHEDYINTIITLPNGKGTLSGGDDGRLIYVDVNGTHKKLFESETPITALCTSQQGEMVFIGFKDGTVYHYDLNSGSLQNEWKFSEEISAILKITPLNLLFIGERTKLWAIPLSNNTEGDKFLITDTVEPIKNLFSLNDGTMLAITKASELIYLQVKEGVIKQEVIKETTITKRLLSLREEKAPPPSAAPKDEIKAPTDEEIQELFFSTFDLSDSFLATLEELLDKWNRYVLAYKKSPTIEVEKPQEYLKKIETLKEKIETLHTKVTGVWSTHAVKVAEIPKTTETKEEKIPEPTEKATEEISAPPPSQPQKPIDKKKKKKEEDLIDKMLSALDI